MRIIVTEYPKSGGSWLVSMLGDALGLAKRDIYIGDEGYEHFDLSTHPWYKDSPSFCLPESCVIKSHEGPASPLHNFQASLIHLVRDGRDVIVSKYFYEKDFCVSNGIIKEFTSTFEEYIEKTSVEWSNFVSAWNDHGVLAVTYENLLADAEMELKKISRALNIIVPDQLITTAVRQNTIEEMRKALANTFKFNTFVRKGIAGDWKNHFNDRAKNIIKRNAGNALVAFGYAKDDRW